MASRTNAWSDFELFKYILGVRLGDFHTEMNVVMKSIQKLMPDFSSRDNLSLGFFSNLLMVSHLLSNKPSIMKKKGN